MKTETKLAHLGRPEEGPVNVPVQRASTIIFSDLKSLRASEADPFATLHYGRLGGPTVWALEDAIAQLEGGHQAIAASSGMAAITTVLLAYAEAGAHVLVARNVYGGTRRLCREVLAKFGVTIELFDPGVGAGLQNLLRPNTKLVFVESPGSSDLRVLDLPAICGAAKARGVAVVVDNTWATPLFYRPLELGADVVVHSASKYIAGHSDALMGLVVCTNDNWRKIKQTSFYLGTNASPDDAALALRGLRTLAVRLRQHERSALAIAEWLAKRPEVLEVLYPALASAPDHALWRRDFTGATGCFIFKSTPVTEGETEAFLGRLRLFALGFGWGGFESLIVPLEEPGAFRVSIGLEDAQDLIDDLKRAFEG